MSTWTILAPILAALLLQVFKDHLKVNPQALTLVGGLAGAISGGSVALAGGDVKGLELALTALMGALLAPGTHSAALKDKLPGRVLKGIGAAVFAGVAAPTDETKP